MTNAKKKTYGLRHQVETYFERQAERLLGESRAAASLTAHRGLFGDASEDAVRSFLKDHLPERYGVGTGHVVSFNANSAQVDTVIFDRQECFKLPITESSTLFSIEGVYAAIEIKSSPSKTSNTKATIKEAVSNIESVKRVVHPFPFSLDSKIPAFTNFTDGLLIETKGPYFVNLMYPVSAILLLGTGSKFATVTKYFRQEQDRVEDWHNRPDLLCVLDEKNFGLCGFDHVVEDKRFVQKFWTETCKTPGQTLATFLYWLVHKMTFERIIERPIFYNSKVQAVWPSVIAPVVQRIRVSVDEYDGGISWPWTNETRKFE